MDFVKSGCEKSWAEVQADSFSFECRGCTKMKELEVELEELRLLVVAIVGREQGGCASSSGGGTVDDKVGKDTRDARESSPQPGRKLRGKEKGVVETGGKTTGVKEREVGETRAKEWEVGETGGKGSGQNVMEGIERKSYYAAVIEGVRKRARVFVGDSIVRKTDRILNKGEDVVVCLPGAKIEAITERVKNIVGSGKGGSVLVHVGTNNVEREGTTAIVRKYRQLVRTLKQTRVEQVILSGILPVMGRRGHKYRNCRGMAINMLVQQLCREEEFGFVDLWGSFVGRADMYMKDGLHLSGKGAAVDSDLGTMTNIFGSKHSLN